MILQDLLRSELCFKAVSPQSVLHNTHAFPLKFHPTLPRLFIEALTQPGELVLDPMCGSGATLIEAALAGRVGLGLDCDPIAVKLSRMKTTRLDLGRVRTTLYRIVNNAFVSSLSSPNATHQFLQTRYSPEVLHFFHAQYCEESIFQLASLMREIQLIEEPPLRNFFEVVFSSIIMVPTPKTKDAIKVFLEKGMHAMASLQAFHGASGFAMVVRGDVRSLPFSDNTVDLVITAPPYGNAMEHAVLHQSSLYWLGADEWTLARYRDHYIGSQAIRVETQELQRDVLKKVLTPMVDADSQMACILGQYFQDVAHALSELRRVLKPGKAAVVVAGALTLPGLILQTHEVFGEMARAVGFHWVSSRALRTGGRHPGRSEQKVGASTFQEYIIGLVKSGC